MKAHNAAIGRRAREAIQHAFEGEMTQGDVAACLSMTPDALSRALSGQRAFASVELVELADMTGSDLHELITGEADPHRLSVVARHSYDRDSGRRDVPGRDRDETLLRDIELVYRQAGELAPTPVSPTSVEQVRDALGPGFVRPLAERVEQRLGVDVIRLPELSTCYSFRLDGRLVIVVPAVGNWFWENFGIGHELGHIAGGHHDEKSVPGSHEKAANAFAAQLLMPDSAVRDEDWATMHADRLASLVWAWGVSISALSNRLGSLGIERSDLVRDWADQPTQKLLRRHLERSVIGQDEITARMTDASARRFPLELRNAHLRRIAAGEIGKESLAWMLGVDAQSLDVDVPDDAAEVDPDQLGDLLGLTSP